MAFSTDQLQCFRCHISRLPVIGYMCLCGHSTTKLGARQLLQFVHLLCTFLRLEWEALLQLLLLDPLVFSFTPLIVDCICSVQFSRSVVSNSLRPHESQHARPPCPSPTPGVYSNSCPLSRWCHPAISSSVIPFSSRPQSFQYQGLCIESALRMRWPKYWSFSFSISSSNEHPGLISFRMNWLDLLAVQGTLKSLLQHHNSKASIFQRSAFFTVQFS